jgi:hypothetical protein
METWMIVSVLRVLANRDAVNLLHFTGNTVDVRTAMDLHGRLKDDSVTVVTLFKL